MSDYCVVKPVLLKQDRDQPFYILLALYVVFCLTVKAQTCLADDQRNQHHGIQQDRLSTVMMKQDGRSTVTAYPEAVSTAQKTAVKKTETKTTVDSGDITALAQECQGCHFHKRSVPPAHFKSGQSRWTDVFCYGCHKDIDDIATNVRQGIDDYRYTTLPVEDRRLMQMDKYPLPYLDAPLMPHLSQMRHLRMNTSSLAGFLKNPTGRCFKKEDRCEAPTMMAYPSITASDIKYINPSLSILPDERDDEKSGDTAQGQKIFTAQCAACHQHSDLSGYDKVALSRFSADWIYRYANGRYTHDAGSSKTELLKSEFIKTMKPLPQAAAMPSKQEKITRHMPIIDISKKQAIHLYAYFKEQKQLRIKQLDREQEKLRQAFENLPRKKTKPVFRRYMWGRFWRDTGCVHCHGIEGRAREVFNTDIEALRNWFLAGNGKSLYLRLGIRQAEQHYGIGASSPGMPMTGQPLPKPLINTIGLWLKEGCLDEQEKSWCHVSDSK